MSQASDALMGIFGFRRADHFRDATEMVWQPIETLPEATKQMFVVQAFNVTDKKLGMRGYTTDPYCVWKQSDGKFSRWPHPFPPTHWMPLPEPPK